MHPKVTVILTSYNHEKFLAQAIDSVLKQTFTDFELFIWDDASSDNSWAVIKQYSDPRIKAFRNDEQRRGIHAFNKVIFELGRGEYIAIHHSDDVWEPTKLEKQVAILQNNPDIGAVFANAGVIDEAGAPFAGAGHFYANVFEQPNRTRHEWLNYFFYQGNALCHPSALVRKSCYVNCNGYRYGLAQLTDFDMWIRLCMAHEIHVLPERLVKFRVLNKEANASGSRPESRIRSATEFYPVFANYYQLETFDEFIKVFPNAHKYFRADGFVGKYALSMLMLEGLTLATAKALAINTLFELLANPDTRKKVGDLYNFDYRDFIKITGKNDIFSTELVSDAVADKEKQIAKLQNAIEGIYASKSWRITAPLRNAATYARKSADTMRMMPHIVRKGGGVWGTTQKAVRVFRMEGWGGIRRRMKGVKTLPLHEFATNAGSAHESRMAVVPYYIDPRLDESSASMRGDVSVAIHIHLRHREMLGEFASRLRSLNGIFDIYVSIPENGDLASIQAEIRGALPQARNIVVEIAPNRGRDIGPMIVQFGWRLAQYDVIGHFHTPDIDQADVMAAGFRDILDRLLGIPDNSGGRIPHILDVLRGKAKVIFPEGNLELSASMKGWGDSYELAREILNKHTRTSIEDYALVEFPQQTMFWGRTNCLREFLTLPLSYEDFPHEPVPADGTLLHALKRLLLVFANQHEGSNYRIQHGDSILDYRHYEEQRDYSSSIVHQDIKVLSYYLPQFHPIPENDLWHGKGFTEWTKVRAATPLFEGHYQQHIPHPDIGYYLLDTPDTFRRQAEMMQRAGVHGQVFYHYWFSGKLILEKPAKMLLEHPDIPMPYCFCWANENWTRRWDGNESEILLGQTYSPEDARAFIRYLLPFFKDPRYIRIDDRPVLLIYRPSSIPDAREYLAIWAEECSASGLPRPYVVSVLTRGATNPDDFGMDAGVERPLHDWTDGNVPEMKHALRAYHDINGSVLPYEMVADFYEGQSESKPFTYFRSLVPIWDNAARYGSNALLLHGSTPGRFQAWMESSIEYTRRCVQEDRRFIVVNAWNEWAEGAHLEPDSRYGYSYLNSVGRSLSGIEYGSEHVSNNAVHTGLKVHLSFDQFMLDQLKADAELRKQFIACLSQSTVFNFCSCTIDSSIVDVLEQLPCPVATNAGESDFLLEFRRTALFDPMLIEKMLQTGNGHRNAVIVPNAYDRSIPVSEVFEDGAVHSHVVQWAPMVLRPLGIQSQDVKACMISSHADCFLAHPSNLGPGERPVVTTIIRFHKSGSISLLRNALYCLAAMQDCTVVPIIAAQDLSQSQKELLESTLHEVPFISGAAPKVKHYDTPDGKGDLRSKMLNEALRQVETRYAAFLDYDDLMMSHAYKWLIDRLTLTGTAVSFGRVYATSYDYEKGLILERKRNYENGYTYQDFLRANHAPLHSFMLDMSRIKLDKVVYHEDQRYMEDYLLTLQIFSPDNADWEGLAENMYVGDYIHSVNRDHTLAITSEYVRQQVLDDPEYIKCEKRIVSIRRSLDKG